MKNRLQRLFIIVTMLYLVNDLIVLGSEPGDRFIDFSLELKKLIHENQKVQIISIMDLRKRPPLVPKSVLKSKISAQDPTSKEIPFLLDWKGDVTKALGGDDSKCKVLIVDPALNVVYNKEYKTTAIGSEIRPLLVKLSG